jgi:hypothetical protein
VGFCLHKLHKRSHATSQVCTNPDGPTSQGQTCLTLVTRASRLRRKQHGPNGSGTTLAIGKRVEPTFEERLSGDKTLPNNPIRSRVLINRHNTQAETRCQAMSKSSIMAYLEDTMILQQTRPPLLGRPGLLPSTAAVLLSQYLTTALRPTMSPLLLELITPRKILYRPRHIMVQEPLTCTAVQGQQYRQEIPHIATQGTMTTPTLRTIHQALCRVPRHLLSLLKGNTTRILLVQVIHQHRMIHFLMG